MVTYLAFGSIIGIIVVIIIFVGKMIIYPTFFVIGKILEFFMWLSEWNDIDRIVNRKLKNKRNARIKKYIRIKKQRKQRDKYLDKSEMLSLEDSMLFNLMCYYKFGSVDKTPKNVQKTFIMNILSNRDEYNYKKMDRNDKINAFYDQCVLLDKLNF